jgi:rod shape determining protein RodA
MVDNARPLGWSLILASKLNRIFWPALVPVCILAGVGVATLFSISGGSFVPWAERHALRFIVALAILVAMAMVDLEVWRKLAYPAYAAALVTLALVPFVGVEALGATRWIDVGAISFQPSELMKLALVAALARYYFWLPVEHVGKLRYVLLPLAMIAVPVALSSVQPDLGSAMLFAALGLSLMFLAGVPLAYFVVAGVTALAFLPVIWSGLYGYQRRRIEVFLNPEIDPFGAGYHITQSKVALSFGGISGKGFMHGMESPFGFVPEKHTDFIASIIGEQWGFVGLLLLLAIYALLIMMMMSMASR